MKNTTLITVIITAVYSIICIVQEAYLTTLIIIFSVGLYYALITDNKLTRYLDKLPD